MLILVAAVDSCDSYVPKERLSTVFTLPLPGAEAPLQTSHPGYGRSCHAPSPKIPAASQSFSSTTGCFPPFFSPCS